MGNDLLCFYRRDQRFASSSHLSKREPKTAFEAPKKILKFFCKFAFVGPDFDRSNIDRIIIALRIVASSHRERIVHRLVVEDGKEHEVHPEDRALNLKGPQRYPGCYNDTEDRRFALRRSLEVHR